MKKEIAAVFIVFLFVTHSVRAAEETPIEPKLAQTIKSFTIREFDSMKEELQGQIIKLKFVARDSDIPEAKDGIIHGEVFNFEERQGKSSGGSGSADVEIPESQRGWFAKITTHAYSKKPIFVIGRVKKTEDGYVLTALGREIKTDAKGPKIVW